jgi:DNA-binding IscR family transcriptional regulator
LVKSPDEISLAAVMAVIEGPPEEVTTSASADSSAARALAETWREIAAVEQEMLEAVTLSELLQRAKRHHENMYYI